jgi:HPt (histidine-containing phosphotransfer) domain-containing protein
MPTKSNAKPRSEGPDRRNPVFDKIVEAVGNARAARLFSDFADDTRLRMERIGEATTAGDVASLQDEAHNLRGTAGHFGFRELCDLAGEIEAACRDGDASRACDLAAHVKQAAEAALETAAAYELPGDGNAAGDANKSSI